MKGTSNIQHPTSNLEVVNKEQGELIDRAKTYLAGVKTSFNHAKGYALLAGTTLNQLKEITPHGQFEAVKEQFTDFSSRWLTHLMLFADHPRLKKEVTSYLKNGQLLLDLPDNEREKLFVRVEEATGDKSIEKMAFEVLKKRHKDKHRATPTPEEAAVAERHQDNEYAKTVLGMLNMAGSEVGQRHLANCDRQFLDLIEDARIELGKAIAPMLRKKGKK